jgi:Ca2+-binding EF-hand superfamily protein
MATRDCMGMKMMDVNHDGMISKEEFMGHHESMYDKMKKAATAWSASKTCN